MKSARAFLPAACLAAATLTGAARAQTTSLPQSMTARGLYDQAVLAIGRKDYEAAAPMLEEAARLEPSALGAKLALAECYEAGGKLASAWGMYGIVEQEAARAGQRDRQERARGRAAALAPKLAHLVLDVPEAVGRLPGLVLLRDGQAVGPRQWGVPLPADRGRHVIVVEALGRGRVTLAFELLADGVTGHAAVPEPPPAAADTPWWSEPIPRDLPPRWTAERRVIAPPPPPPERGRPLVELRGGLGLALYEAPQDTLVCAAQCLEAVDGRAHQLFYVGGEGYLPSPRFRLHDRLGRVTIEASPGSTVQRGASIAALAMGSAAALGCGVALPVAARAEGPAGPLTGACLAVGLLAVAVGIPTLLFNRTTVTLTSSAPAHAIRF